MTKLATRYSLSNQRDSLPRMGTYHISKLDHQLDYKWLMALTISEHVGVHTHLLVDAAEGGTAQQEQSLWVDLLCSCFQVEI